MDHRPAATPVLKPRLLLWVLAFRRILLRLHLLLLRNRRSLLRLDFLLFHFLYLFRLPELNHRLQS